MRGEHTVLLASLGIGKTTTCLNFIAANIMRKKYCLLITHEGRPLDIINKLRQRLAQATRQDFFDAIQGKNKIVLAKLESIENALNKYLCFIPHNKAGSLFVEDVVDLIRLKNDQLFAKHQVYYDLIVDDYPAKLLSRNMKGFKEFRHGVKYCYDQFQQLALEYNCHAISPVQTNREGLKQNRNREGQDFLGSAVMGESLGVAQDAGNIISLNRSLDDIRKNIMYFHIAKTRQGPSEITICCNTDFSRGITHDQSLGISLVNQNVMEPRKQALDRIVGESHEKVTPQASEYPRINRS